MLKRQQREAEERRKHKMTVEVGLSSAYGTCSIVASNVVVVVVRIPSPSLHFAAERESTIVNVISANI